MWNPDFEKYLILIEQRSVDYGHEPNNDLLFSKIEYFRDCHSRQISAYKALTFLALEE